jgi:hypothetical protein
MPISTEYQKAVQIGRSILNISLENRDDYLVPLGLNRELSKTEVFKHGK